MVSLLWPIDRWDDPRSRDLMQQGYLAQRTPGEQHQWWGGDCETLRQRRANSAAGQPGLIISPLFGLITFVGGVEADQIGIGCGADKILEMFYWGELVRQTVTIEPQFSHVAPPLQWDAPWDDKLCTLGSLVNLIARVTSGLPEFYVDFWTSVRGLPSKHHPCFSLFPPRSNVPFTSGLQQTKRVLEISSPRNGAKTPITSNCIWYDGQVVIFITKASVS